MERQSFATKDELWRIQESLTELSATQVQHTEKIMRIEKKLDDGTKPRNVWGPASPFPGILGSTHQGMSTCTASGLISLTRTTESTLNPAAEAFHNFDADPGISSLSLDNADDSRRAAASRANSVRFDESANNHYGSSRQSIDLPTRTGSGLGSHPLSERSLSHRSDGRGSSAGFGRTNSFGLDSSRLLGSIHNSPKVSGNPPPGFFVLGPCPSIIRCWLTETFTNDALLYAAVCTGSSASSVGISLVQKLGLADQIIEESSVRKIKLPVYLTEARIQHASSRSASPVPQVPTLIAKFVVVEEEAEDKSIQIVLGSDILRSHSADILFSQDKLSIFDEDRNQLSIPLVRPENNEVYKNLATGSRKRTASMDLHTLRQSSTITHGEQSRPGIIGRPSKVDTMQSPQSPGMQSPGGIASAGTGDTSDARRSEAVEPTPRSSTEIPHARPNEDAKSATESEKSYTTPVSKSNSGVWGNSWRSASAVQGDSQPTATSTYSRPAASRPMKVLRPTKSSGSTAPRTPSTSTPSTDSALIREGLERNSSLGDAKAGVAVPTKSNPIGSGSAFGWLNSGQQRRTATNGS
jgi:hypothetical protein